MDEGSRLVSGHYHVELHQGARRRAIYYTELLKTPELRHSATIEVSVLTKLQIGVFKTKLLFLHLKSSQERSVTKVIV